MRGITVLAAAVVLASSCGHAPQSTPQPAGDRLYEPVSTRGGAVVDIIDASSRNVLGTLPLGIASNDWKHYYDVRAAVLEDVDPRSGGVLHSLTLGRPYDIPRVTITGMTG